MRFGLSNAIALVGQVGRGEDKTQKDIVRAIEYIYSNVNGRNECIVENR